MNFDLERLLRFSEDDWLDFKQEYKFAMDEFAKDVVAMFNSSSHGSNPYPEFAFLIIGVRDNGEVCGIDETSLPRNFKDTAVATLEKNLESVPEVTFYAGSHNPLVLIVAIHKDLRDPIALKKCLDIPGRSGRITKHHAAGVILFRRGPQTFAAKSPADFMWLSSRRFGRAELVVKGG